MNKPDIATAGSALRRRLIDDMTLRRFGEKTQHDYIRIVSRFSDFLGRSLASATAEDIVSAAASPIQSWTGCRVMVRT